MTQAIITFERQLARDVPTAQRIGAATRREPTQFVKDIQPVTITGQIWQLIRLARAAVPAVFILGVSVWGCVVAFALVEPELARLLSSLAGHPIPGAAP